VSDLPEVAALLRREITEAIKSWVDDLEALGAAQGQPQQPAA
jgi:hypothetical protein